GDRPGEEWSSHAGSVVRIPRRAWRAHASREAPHVRGREADADPGTAALEDDPRRAAMIYFLDASALAKRYLVEVGTDRVRQLFRRNSVIAVARISEVEVASALVR